LAEKLRDPGMILTVGISPEIYEGTNIKIINTGTKIVSRHLGD